MARVIDRDDGDRRYFLARAEMELELAQASMSPAAVSSHYQLAGLYLDLAYNNVAFADWKATRCVRPGPAAEDPAAPQTATA